MVQPAPQPFSVVATASTSGWSGSGVNPASGVSGIVGQYGGPHYVEEQSLNINYVRVPIGSASSNSLSLLTGAAGYRIRQTELACFITASYSRRKVDAFFTTSSYVQPQKFQFIGVSADSQGNNYGAIDASTLGPAGDIVTVQPWYYRRPWNDTQDTEVVSSVLVANFALGTSSIFDGTLRSVNQSQRGVNFKEFFIEPTEDFSFLRSDGIYSYGGILSDTAYKLNGGYGTGQESLVKIIHLIEAVSSRLSTTSLFRIPATLGGLSFVPDAGLPLYASYRHNYS